MSISNFCIQQREKEKAALKTLLVYSLAGSAVFHVVLAFGMTLFWPKEASLADEPIEIIVVESPEPEVKQPEIKPQPVVTPPPKPIPVVTPEPIKPPEPELATPPPQPKVEIPKPVEKPPEPEIAKPESEPFAEKPEPVAEKPEPIAPEPKTVTPEKPLPPEKPAITPEPLTPPSVPEEPNSQLSESTPPPDTPNTQTTALQTPSENERSFRDSLTASTPTTTNSDISDPSPQTPGEVRANQEAPTKPTATSQPLQANAAENRQFRDNIANSEVLTGNPPTDDALASTSGAPGEVRANREAPAKPTVTSQPLQTSGAGNRGFRDSFSSSNSPSSGANPGDDALASNSGVPGEVRGNREAPAKPTTTSQPLQTSAAGNRGFRDSFSNSNNSSSSPNSDDFSPTAPGTSTGVAANRGVPPKASGGNPGGDRNARRSGSGGGVRCLSNCNPEYPSSLADKNIEGRPVVRFVVEADGNPAEAELAQSSGNSELDQAAVAAVQEMRFAPPENGRRAVRLAINFANTGSDFERQARQRRDENERQRRKRERQAQ